MNKFVTTALALAATGVATHASGDSEWLELDREIGTLASSLSTQGGAGVEIGALIRASYAWNDGDLNEAAFNDDTSGFNMDDVDAWLEGEVGDFDWRISMDIGSDFIGANIAELEDAYVGWKCGEYFDARLGQFKPRVLRTASIDPEHTFFQERTLLGSAFDIWDEGIGFMGTYDPISWFASVMNGSNDFLSDHFYSIRAEWSFGNGAGAGESAMGAGDEASGTLGGSFAGDDTQSGSDTTIYVVDFAGTFGQIGLFAEIADLDDDVSLSTGSDIWTVPPSGGTIPDWLEADSTPWDATLSYALNEEFEAAVRFQSMDNSDDTTLLSVGLNWYQSGDMAKWHVSYNDVSSDFEDGSAVIAGVSVGSSR